MQHAVHDIYVYPLLLDTLYITWISALRFLIHNSEQIFYSCFVYLGDQNRIKVKDTRVQQKAYGNLSDDHDIRGCMIDIMCESICLS